MGEIRKELKAFGEPVSGLKAGATYRFTAKVAADVSNAKKSAAASQAAAGRAREGHDDLKGAREALGQGDVAAARDAFRKAGSLQAALLKSVDEARAFARRAHEDWAKAGGSVKQAYETAHKAADEARKHAEGLSKAYDDLVRSVGAAIEERASRVAHGGVKQAEQAKIAAN